jgi:hypothetical protein
MRCAAHPAVETELGCSKCGTPICPGCLHHTPVGARCGECANFRRLPQYDVSAAYLIRGLVVAVAVGAALGAVWGVLVPFGAFFFFGLLLGAGLGYCVGQAVSAATNRKVGSSLQVTAAAGVVIAYLVRSTILASALRHVEFVDLVTTDMFGYVVVVVGVVVAMGRVR